MRELRSHIEHIVRPIRATERRKYKMREELLAHLSGTLEEELAKGQTAEAALEHALRRFGDHETLRRDLQASVPVTERFLFAQIPYVPQVARRQNESAVHHAGRMTVYVALYLLSLTALVLGLAVLTRALNGRSRPNIALVLQGAAAFHTGMLFCYFFCMLCVYGIRRALRSRPVRFGQLVVAGTYSALAAVITFLGCVITRVLVPSFFAYTQEGFGFVFKVIIVVVPCAVVMQALQDSAQARRHREWQGLIEEE